MKKILISVLVASVIFSQLAMKANASSTNVSSKSKAVKVDKDNNGIPDDWQSKYHLGYGKNIALKDNDKDGLNNLQEYQLNLNPLSSDTDKDGIKDGNEDNDNDGLTNLQEISIKSNPLSADSNNNGIKDSDEDTDIDGLTTKQEFIVGTNPLIADTNKNGILDGNEDKDGDGLSNEAEFELGDNPVKADSDNDGIKDGNEDSDKDGVADRQELKGLHIQIVNDAGKKFLLQYELSKKKSKTKVRDEIGLGSGDAIMAKLSLTSSMSKDEVVTQIQQALGVTNISKYEFEVKFADGKEINVEGKISNTQNQNKDDQSTDDQDSGESSSDD